MKKQILPILKKASIRQVYSVAFVLVFLPILAIAQHTELEQARQFAINKRYQAAENELVKLVETYPDFLPAKLLRAHSHSWWGQYDLAVAEFKAILNEFPDNEDALIGLA